jgi:hypothetical protein
MVRFHLPAAALAIALLTGSTAEAPAAEPSGRYEAIPLEVPFSALVPKDDLTTDQGERPHEPAADRGALEPSASTLLLAS